MEAVLRAMAQWQVVLACEFLLAAMLAARSMGGADEHSVGNLARLLEQTSRIMRAKP